MDYLELFVVVVILAAYFKIHVSCNFLKLIFSVRTVLVEAVFQNLYH
jgi:hypothetical protein